MNAIPPAALLAALLVSVGCGGVVVEPGDTTGGGGAPGSSGVTGSGGSTGTPPAPCPADPWARVYSGYGAKQGYVTGDGACGLAFTAGGQIDYGGGVVGDLSGMAVVRMDAQGSLVWGRAFGHDAGMDPPRVAVDAQGFVTVAGASGSPIDFGGGEVKNIGLSDLYVARWDPEGHLAWARRFSGTVLGLARATVGGLAVGPDGVVVIAGSYQHDLDLGLGAPLPVVSQTGGYVLALDASGKSLWQRGFAATGAGYVEATADAIGVSPGGEVVVAGGFIGTLDAGTGPLDTSPTWAVSFVAGYGLDGAPRWSRTFGKFGEMDPQALAFDAAGRAVVEGRFTGTIQIGSFTLTETLADRGFLVVLGEDHEPTLAQRLSGSMPGGLVTDAQGDMIVVGDGVQALDAGGNLLWQRGGAPSTWFPSLGSLGVDASGDVLVTGAFYGGVSFDVVSLPDDGLYDQRVFVAKLGP